MTVGRDVNLDAARGLGILLVICGHLLEPTFIEQGDITGGLAFTIWRTIYAFHMPFFFLVTGMADKLVERRRASNVTGTALQLVLTALVFSLLAYIPQVIAGSVSITEILMRHLAGQRLGLAPLWFLIALALVRILYAAASKISDRVVYWSFLGAVLVASEACAKYQFKPWYFQSLLGGFPFYLIGRLTNAEGSKVSAPAALCGLAALLACSSDNFVHLAAGQYGDLPNFVAGALGGCCLSLALIEHLRGVALTAAAYLGRRSFELFVISGIVLAASPMMRQLDNATGILLILLVGIPSQIVLARFLRRPITAARRAIDAVVEVWRHPRGVSARA